MPRRSWDEIEREIELCRSVIVADDVLPVHFMKSAALAIRWLEVLRSRSVEELREFQRRTYRTCCFLAPTSIMGMNPDPTSTEWKVYYSGVARCQNFNHCMTWVLNPEDDTIMSPFALFFTSLTELDKWRNHYQNQPTKYDICVHCGHEKLWHSSYRDQCRFTDDEEKHFEGVSDCRCETFIGPPENPSRGWLISG